MLIVCPTRATSYDVDTASLRPNGRKVRCVRCRTVWRAELGQAEKLIAAGEALGPVRRAVDALAEAAVAAEPSAAAPPPTSMPSSPQAPSRSMQRRRCLWRLPRGRSRQPCRRASPRTWRPAMLSRSSRRPSRRPISTLSRRRCSTPLPPQRPAPETRLAAVAAAIGNPGIGHYRRHIVGWRTDFVRALPQTASFYAAIGMPVNLRGVTFDGLTTNSEQHEGVPILVVEGNIINNAGRMIDVPRLRFAVRDAARRDLFLTAVPPRASLPPGEAVPFRTRLASPPPDAHDVLVRFVNRFDILSGSR